MRRTEQDLNLQSPRPKRSAQGFSLIAYALLALVLLGTLSGIAWKILEFGKDAIRVEWAEANRMAQEVADAERAAREAEARKSVAALQNAEKEARNHAERWRKAQNALRDVPLAVCPAPSAPPGDAVAAPSGASVEPPGLALRLTPAFVLLYDATWTGPAGEPLWPHPGGSASGAVAADSVEPEELLNVHAENAARCSENARRQKALIDLIKKFQQQ